MRYTAEFGTVGVLEGPLEAGVEERMMPNQGGAGALDGGLSAGACRAMTESHGGRQPLIWTGVVQARGLEIAGGAAEGAEFLQQVVP